MKCKLSIIHKKKNLVNFSFLLEVCVNVKSSAIDMTIKTAQQLWISHQAKHTIGVEHCNVIGISIIN